MTLTLVKLPEWQALQQHYQQLENQKMSDWFAQDPMRFERFSLRCDDLLFDYSKNRLTSTTLELLIRLALALELPAKIQGLFSAQPVNVTEDRPALHMALRHSIPKSLWVKQTEVRSLVQEALEKMEHFVEKVRAGLWRGSTGKTIQAIVNIGIGGSHLGPLMTTEALSVEAESPLRFHFISDVDQEALQAVWKQLDPERTLFIISSKSFTTTETLVNARSCYRWLEEKLGIQALQSHFIAVTAQKEKALHFGIPEEQIFPIWEWVGGRYSVWSAIGLPLALKIGMKEFHAFLAGAAAADRHFCEVDFRENIPVIMALLGIWYVNFFKAPTQAIIPYAYRLRHLRAYLQQLDMESNGKRRTQKGDETLYATGPIIWGELGIHGQHAFHQLLHQGTHLVPVDFIVVGQQAGNGKTEHQDLLIANALSQARALMQGKQAQAFAEELKAQGLPASEAEQLALHKEIPGNRPSSILFLNKLTPRSLGLLLAFYEHKVFVQSVIWDVNPFDQWGVELGKTMLAAVMDGFLQDQTDLQQDSSTRNLMLHYKRLKEPA